jgi:VWFA-related protein
MYSARIPLLLLAGTLAFGQQAPPQELPTAPSATLTQGQQAPSQPPAQQPAAAPQPKPAASENGMLKLETLGGSHPRPKTAEQTAQNPTKADDTKPAAQAPAEDQPTTTIRVQANEKNVIFTVTDKHGRFVKNLTKEKFILLDDNKPPESIKDFRAETDLPLRVGLLVDASNSIRERFKFEQEAAIEFLNQIIRPKKDQAFVIGFDTTPDVTQDFTNDTEQLANGVRMLRPGGGTAMFDAIYGACRDKLLKVNSRESSLRRAVILLSDGEDNQSRVTREEAIEMAQRAEVIVYTISTNVSGTKTRGDKVLERIAESTGGRAFFPFKIEDVANAFHDVQEELRSQYAIAYKPAAFQMNGQYRTISISAEDKKLHVRAPKGYFAPRDEPARASNNGGE